MRTPRSEIWIPNAQSFKIRPGRQNIPEDWDEVMRVLRSVGVPAVSKTIPRFSIENCLMAINNDITGRCVGILLHSAPSRKMYVDYIGVVEDHRRQGWATSLLCAALLHFYHAGASEIQMRVPKDIVAMATRCGFRSPPDADKSKEDVLFMFTRVQRSLEMVFHLPAELL